MADKSNNRDAHQRELAQSGYRVPDNFYVEPIPPQESAEEKSGDGGSKAIAAADETDSAHGFKGKLLTADEFAAEQKNKTGPVDNKALTPAAPGAPAAGADANAASDANAAGSVDYASSAAESAARDARLTAADFRGVKPSGEKGFTKADIDAIVARKAGK